MDEFTKRFIYFRSYLFGVEFETVVTCVKALFTSHVLFRLRILPYVIDEKFRFHYHNSDPNNVIYFVIA